MSFDPSIGGEVQKTRPAVVLSNDTANALLNRVQVVTDLQPGRASLPGKSRHHAQRRAA